MSWEKVAKRIDKLIKIDRYFNEKDKLLYGEYSQRKDELAKRWKFALDMRNFFHEYNDFHDKLREYDKKFNMYVLSDCTSCIPLKTKKTYTLTIDGDYALPLMQNALKEIIESNTQFSERAKEFEEILNGDMSLPILPEPEPEYVTDYHLGDMVYIGANEYEILSFDENEVLLYDYQFPIMNKTFERADFDIKVRENPSNKHLLREVSQEIQTPVIEQETSEISTETVQQSKTIRYSNVGDFYEVTGEPAKIAADELGITLMSRTINNEKVPMVGFPISVAEEYSKTLNDSGYTVLLPNGEEYSTATNETQEVETNIGAIPEEDYREIMAIQNGFDSYEDMYNQGVRLGNEYDVEPIETAAEEIIPVWEQRPKAKVKGYDLYPHIPLSQRSQFDIVDDNLGVGSSKEQYRANVKAIRLLKTLETEQRYATLPEQEILSHYVGWGGLSDVFDESKTSWTNEYFELKSLLSEEEYKSAMESTLTAFYTPPVVIRSMYKALENMGQRDVASNSPVAWNILEPSCGVGNFIGLLPKSMSNSKVYGVEIDSISGRIAQQLYQKSSIAIEGYEKTNLPDSFYDVAIGNVPFGQFKVQDKKYDKHNWLIHDYFFGRTLDKVRPGGVVAFISSKGTLDKENSSVRRYLAQRAELLGAIRLPNNTFSKNAGTEVTSDIIFLQKRDRVISTEPNWVQLGKDENGNKINNYFVDNPEMILGEFKEVSGPFGPQTECIAFNDQNFEDLLSNAIGNINAQIDDYEVELSEEETDNSIPADPTVRNFSYTLVDGKIHFRENSLMSPVDVSATAESRIKGMIKIRDSVRTLIELQTEDYPDDEIKAEQQNLNTLYDDYTKKYGVLSSRGNSIAFSNDSSYSLLTSLEIIDENGNLERKADMFTKRTIKPHKAIEKVDTASEALAVSLAEKACVDI